MKVVKGTKTTLGGCNFHNNDEHYYVVYQLEGNQTTIRICNKCLKKAKEVR